MIRQIAATTGQSAQMLRAMNQRACNATPSSLTNHRVDVGDALAHLLMTIVLLKKDYNAISLIYCVNRFINVWGPISIWPLDVFLHHQNYLPLFHLHHVHLNLHHGNRDLRHHLHRRDHRYVIIVQSWVWTL